MKTKMFIAGLVSGLVVAALLLGLLLLGMTQVRRATAAVLIASAFPNAQAVDTPFTDISHLSQNEQDAIAKIYGLRITAGTSATAFSPDSKTQLYQWFIFAGRTLMRLQQ